MESSELQARWPNFSLDIAQRLDWFVGLREFLVKDGDKHKLLPTVDAIVKTYKEGALKWRPGYVTYWSHGKQLTGLRVFDWAEFLHWNFTHKGGEGFWVEGVR